MKRKPSVIYSELKETESSRKLLEKEISSLKSKEDSLKAELQSIIPENETLDRIHHKSFIKPSVSYAKVYTDLLTIIPKTKHKEAEKIKANYTTEKLQHTFKIQLD